MTEQSAPSWHLITGEYPPDHGGVADYTRQIAAGLAADGCEVHVWCRGDELNAEQVRPRLTIHRTAGSFDRAGLRRLSRALDAFAGRRLVFVQYVPHAFGCRAMNIPFCLWVLGRRRRGDEVWVMFHEVRLGFFRRPLKWNIIALAQRVMGAILVRAASKIFVSTSAWIPLLRRLGLGDRRVESLPIPSNFALDATPSQIAAARRAMSPDDAFTVGHFGTYGPTITSLLTPLFDRLAQDHPDFRIALFGRGAAAYRRSLIETHPGRDRSIAAFDDLSPDDVTGHIQAVDLMLQPFPDGASFRRTSLMACLASATPTITTYGDLSEPVWQTQTICPTVPVGDVEATAEAVRRLLADPEARHVAGRRAAAYYERHFSLERTIATLLGRPPEPASQPAEQGIVVDR